MEGDEEVIVNNPEISDKRLLSVKSLLSCQNFYWLLKTSSNRIIGCPLHI
jgi:hypothetical protein